MASVLLAASAFGVALSPTTSGVLVNGRSVTASALRSVAVVDTSGATRSVDELVGKKGASL
jgi:hypothetical protein